MQGRLRESYLEMGSDNEATVAPCGAAWHQMSVVNNFFWNGLYSSDGSHPSAWGTYLNACVFYATILRRLPVGIPYYSSIGQQDAGDLQQLAEDIVLDSLSTWYIGHADPMAVVDFTLLSGLTASFANSSVNAISHYWDFGDGSFSTDTDPQHVYPSVSSYQVMYVAYSACTSDTTFFSVDFSPFISVNELTAFERVIVTQDELGTMIGNGSDRDLKLDLLDISGRLLVSDNVSSHSRKRIAEALNSGIYLLRVSSKNETGTIRFFIRW